MVRLTGEELTSVQPSSSGSFFGSILPRVTAAAQRVQSYAPPRRKRNWWEEDDVPEWEAPTYEVPQDAPPPMYAEPPPEPMAAVPYERQMVEEFAAQQGYGDDVRARMQDVSAFPQPRDLKPIGFPQPKEAGGAMGQWYIPAGTGKQDIDVPQELWEWYPTETEKEKGFFGKVKDAAGYVFEPPGGSWMPEEGSFADLVMNAGARNFEGITGHPTTDAPGGVLGEAVAASIFDPLTIAPFGVPAKMLGVGAKTAKAISIAGTALGAERSPAARFGTELAINAGARAASTEAGTRLPQDIPFVPGALDPAVRGGLVLGTGILGGGGAAVGARGVGPAGRAVGRGVRSLDEGARALDAKINEPAGFEAGGRTTAGMDVPEKPVARVSGESEPHIDALAKHGIDFGFDESGNIVVDDVARAEGVLGQLEREYENLITQKGPGWQPGNKTKLFGSKNAPKDDGTGGVNYRKKERGGQTVEADLSPGSIDHAALDDAARLTEILNPEGVDFAAAEAMRAKFPKDAMLPSLRVTETGLKGASKAAANRGVAQADAFVAARIRPDYSPANVKIEIQAESSRVRALAPGNERLTTNQQAYIDRLTEWEAKIDWDGGGFARPEAPVARAEPPVVPPRKPVIEGRVPVPGKLTGTQLHVGDEVFDGTGQKWTVTAEPRSTAGATKVRVVNDAGTKSWRRLAMLRGEPPNNLPPVRVGASPEFESARESVLKAVREEANIRKVGTASREIAEGRTRQAAGISGGLKEAVAAGKTGDDLIEAARGGARTGQLRKTVAALNITPAEKAALMDEFVGQTLRGEMRQFDFLRISTAVSKLINGEGLQPNEIKMIRKVFGDEVADAVASRPLTAAQQAAKEAREIAKSREYSARAVEQQERAAETALQRANRQATVAAEKADRAKARAEAAVKRAADKADADEIASGRALQGRVAAKNESALARETQAVNAARHRLAREADRLKAQAEKARDEAVARWIKARTDASTAEMAAWQREAGLAAEAVKKSDPAANELHVKALKIIDQKVENPQLREAMGEAVKVWHDQNRTILDAMADTAHETAQTVKAFFTGDLADPYLNTLLHRKNTLIAVLKGQGMDVDIAKKVADVMVKEELAVRYGSKSSIPSRLIDAMERNKPGKPGAMSGIEMLVQDMKNTMFGIADVGVFGQQFLAALGTGGTQALIGLANRMLAVLHMPHVNTYLDNVTLGRDIQYTLDGLAPRGSRTGIVTLDADVRPSWLGRIPGAGPHIDRVIEGLTDFQFGKVLGSVRALIHEGNLTLLRLGGQDIQNPLVRRTSADFANSTTSYAARALNARRASAEGAALLSPSMTRAQFNALAQVTKLLSPGATASERILAGAVVTSFAGTLSVTGYMLNAMVGGEDEWEWNPLSPKYGNITLPGGRHISIAPQKQLLNLIKKASIALKDEDPGKAADELQKFIIGRSSPVLQTAEKAAGYGYEEGSGYALGDYGNGLHGMDRIVSVLPLPPLATSLLLGEDPSWSGTPLDVLGMSNYEESKFQRFNREVEKDPQFQKTIDPVTGKERKANGYWDLEEHQQAEADEKYGRPPSSNPETVARQEAYALAKEEKRVEQEASDKLYAEGKLTAEQWRNDLRSRAEYLAGFADAKWGDVKFENRRVTPLDEYYSLINSLQAPDGKPDWDAIDKAVAAKDSTWQAYVDRNLPAITGTDQVKMYRADVDVIAASGVWDMEKGRTQFLREHPEVRALMKTWGYSQNITKYLDEEDKYNAEQALDDAKLGRGELTRLQWRDRYHDRTLKLRAAGEGIFEDMPDDGTNPLAGYYAAIDRYTEAGNVNWRKVDQWVAQQPADLQTAIGSRVTGGLNTPRVKAYREAVKKVSASGYWDMGDKLAARFARRFGLPADIGADEMQQAVFMKERDKLLARGMSPLEADMRADIIADRKLRGFTSLLSKQRQLFRRKRTNRDIAVLLVDFGWWDPGIEDTARLSRYVA